MTLSTLYTIIYPSSELAELELTYNPPVLVTTYKFFRAAANCAVSNIAHNTLNALIFNVHYVMAQKVMEPEPFHAIYFLRKCLQVSELRISFASDITKPFNVL